MINHSHCLDEKALAHNIQVEEKSKEMKKMGGKSCEKSLKNLIDDASFLTQ
jgi:hypothetical protein